MPRKNSRYKKRAQSQDIVEQAQLNRAFQLNRLKATHGRNWRGARGYRIGAAAAGVVSGGETGKGHQHGALLARPLAARRCGLGEVERGRELVDSDSVEQNSQRPLSPNFIPHFPFSRNTRDDKTLRQQILFF